MASAVSFHNWIPVLKLLFPSYLTVGKKGFLDLDMSILEYGRASCMAYIWLAINLSHFLKRAAVLRRYGGRILVRTSSQYDGVDLMVPELSYMV